MKASRYSSTPQPFCLYSTNLTPPCNGTVCNVSYVTLYHENSYQVARIDGGRSGPAVRQPRVRRTYRDGLFLFWRLHYPHFTTTPVAERFCLSATVADIEGGNICECVSFINTRVNTKFMSNSTRLEDCWQHPRCAAESVSYRKNYEQARAVRFAITQILRARQVKKGCRYLSSVIAIMSRVIWCPPTGYRTISQSNSYVMS